MNYNIIIKKKLLPILAFLTLLITSCSEDESMPQLEVSISAEEITFDSQADEQMLTITSNYSYQLELDADWVTITQSEDIENGGGYLLDAQANSLLEQRSTTLEILIDYIGATVKYEVLLTQLQSGESLTEVSSSNTFSNGDIVFIDDTQVVNSINLLVSEPYTSSTDIISEVRDICFNFGAMMGSFDFSVQMTAPDDSGSWKLCQLEDDFWVEIEDATYDAGCAKASFTLDFTQSRAGVDYKASSLAFIKTDSLMSDIEVVLNPSTRNALAASISFESCVAVTPTMTLKGQDDNDIIQEFVSATDHQIDVLGLYNNYDNTVYIDFAYNQDITYRKAFTLRPEYPYIDDYVFETEYDEALDNEPDHVYINSGQASGSFSTDADEFGYRVASVGIDQYGKIRWVYSDDMSEGANFRMFPIIYQGEQYLARHISGRSGYTSLNVHDYIGKRAVSWSTALYRPHHEAVMGPDNIIVIPEIKEGSSADECMIREVDLTTGETISLIDLDDIIDPDRARVTTVGSGDDRVHINSIAYSESDDCYIISMRYQGLVKIRRGSTDSSGIVWWMTPHYNVADDWTQYLLEPTNFEKTPENWNLGQHTVSILPNGDIMMYDNHNEPIQDTDASMRISRVWVVRIDQEEMSVESINEWRTPDETFCMYMSSAYYHSQSSTTVSGWAVPEIVYESSYPDGKLLFKGSFKSVNSIGDIYRFYKLKLYQYC